MIRLPGSTPAALRAILERYASGTAVYPDAATIALAVRTVPAAAADEITYASAHALPSAEAIALLFRRVPSGATLREVGAGTGLWTSVLRRALPDRRIVAYENHAWADRYTARWVDDIQDGDAAAVARANPGDPLLVIWPFGPMFAALLDAMPAGGRIFHHGPWDAASGAPEFIAAQRHRLRALDAAPLYPATANVRADLVLYERL